MTRGKMRTGILLSAQELVHRQPGLGDDGAQGSTRDVAGMAGDHGDFARGAVDPKFVAALSRTQILKAVPAQMRDDLAILERGQQLMRARAKSRATTD